MSKPTYQATLIRGRQFTKMLPNGEDDKNPKALTFMRGEPKPVTKAVADILKKVTDSVTISSGGEKYAEERPKFEVVPLPKDDEADPADPADTRARTAS